MLFKIHKWGNKNIKKINHFSTSKRVSHYDCNANSMAWMTEFNAHLIWSYLNKVLAPGLKDRLHAHCPSTLPLNYISHHNILLQIIIFCHVFCIVYFKSSILYLFSSHRISIESIALILLLPLEISTYI